MAVLQLSKPPPSSADKTSAAPASASSTSGASKDEGGIAIAPRTPNSSSVRRNYAPSRSNVVVGSEGNNFSTTPVTSNLASVTFFDVRGGNNVATSNAAAAAAANYVGGGGVPIARNAGGGPFSTASQQQQRPAASSSQMSQAMQPSVPAMVSNNNVLPYGHGGRIPPQQKMMHANHQRGVISQQQMANASAVNNMNPPWARMGGSGMVNVQGGRFFQSSNLLGNVTVGGAALASPNLSRGDVGTFANRNRLINAQSNNLLGTVTVGGAAMTTPSMNRGDVGQFANRNRLANAQAGNLLGNVTVGGAAMTTPNMSRGDVGAFANRNRLANAQASSLLGNVAVVGTAMTNAGAFGSRGADLLGAVTVGGNQAMVTSANVNRVVDGGKFASRGRLGGGAPPRPPLMSVTSAGSRAAPPGYPSGGEVGSAKDHHQYPQQLTALRAIQSTPIGDSQMGVGAPAAVSNPRTILDYDEYGTDGPVGVMDYGAEAPSFVARIPEVALATGLVPLRIHESTFGDGVELALHPDVFKTGMDGKDDKLKPPNKLRPGDLVEIRVWNARPGVDAEKNSCNHIPVLKSKIKTGARTSLHSRNTSLATLSSSISNTSLMYTPRTLSAQEVMSSQPPPPLPNIVGGDRLSSPLHGSPASISSEAGALHGEHLLEPTVEQTPAAAISSNLSFVFAGASSLFRKVPAPPMGPGVPHDPSMLSHSQGSSLASASTLGGLHSRDSSLVTASASWMNAPNASKSLEETPSSSTVVMEPVSEGSPQPQPQPQPHPLVANLSQHSMTAPGPESQLLRMRRDSNGSSTGPPPLPPHPLSSSVPPSSVGGVGSETSTPSSHHSSSPVSTPTTRPASKNNGASDSKPPPISMPQKPPPPPQYQTDPSSSRKQAAGKTPSPDSAKEDTKFPSDAVQAPDVSFNLGVAAGTRQRASTGDAAASSDFPSGGAIPSHIRNLSTTKTGASVGSSNAIPAQRRHRTSAASASGVMPSLAQILPPPVSRKATIDSIAGTAKDDEDGDVAKNINYILQATHFVRVSFVIPVSEGSLSSIKSGARTQVSLLRSVANLYDITDFDTVTVTQITRSKVPFVQQSISADFLTITFKDQFVSRGDMYKFQRQFCGSWVYEGKRLTFNGIRTNTKVIRHGDHVIRSGLISEDTKLTFRSRSARIIWLVQMSMEMWDFASPYEAVGNQISHESSCKIYFDKFVEFVRRLFDKWKKLQVTHNLTVVFFSRTYIRHQDGEKEGKSSSSIHVDSDGRMFEDHYKIVVENETNFDSLIHRMKKEFVSYPKSVNWDMTLGSERTPSTASQGNVLEAINITLNLLHLHYIDRDLHRTGNSIVIITPGNGVFEIEKNLAGITKQRMMDNGIGSDMLSLGLPPLHVAPFFLYKEKSTSSAEEIQGFDDWKTYFEVPHWMNLSFTDYDNEEEPMLYKEHLTDDDILADAKSVNAIQREDETVAASNGFLKRNITDSYVVPEIQLSSPSLVRQQYRHLISDRGFEDILQACRPRNRGEYGSGLPASLSVILKKCAAVGNRDQDSLLIQTTANASRSKYLEWGAVNFDDFTRKRLMTSSQKLPSNRSLSGSQSSPSSSFTSIGSYKFPSHLLGISLLQSTTSLDGGVQSVSSGGGDNQLSMHKEHSDGSMTTLDNEEMQIAEEGQNLSAIAKIMADHDKSAFTGSSKTNHEKSNEISKNLTGNSGRNCVNESYCPGSPIVEARGIRRSQSSMFPRPNKGGIEAALVQYDDTRQSKEQDSVPRAGLLDNYTVYPAEAVTRSSLAVSPLSIGMPFSLDRRNESEGLRPSVMRLVAPDVIPRVSKLGNAADGFQPLDSQRKNSFHLSQTKTKSRDDSYNQSKMLGQTAKESRLGDCRNSQRERPKENGNQSDHKASLASCQPHQQTTDRGANCDPRLSMLNTSPQRTKKKKQHHSRKHHHHHSYRHRRKPWVLNPFRQEDEEEVLAKRTHNRRRWSHVFPLGEDEFKRYAGPNWKSLCQPAILPLTIDFHPSPQNLEDKDKFSVKQYSVTLPPMDKTGYKSHKELLDDLLIQRMRQDFQIVPRNRIQQSTRRNFIDNMLEATLSMGHKIQRLSYNPSTDSVDVVQYYAKFAEGEIPQTYRYLLWSALRQDYVAVHQKFTKYSRPYKWNELDMLISGDEVTTILEGMRYPRISFVIVPDPFTNKKGEDDYIVKFQELVKYFSKIQSKDGSKNICIEMHRANDVAPQSSSRNRRFEVDLRKKRDDKYEWMELVHDSNCDTRRTFRMTIQWLVAVGSKIDDQARLLRVRCSKLGLELVSVPHYSSLISCFMNPFAVPITTPIRNKNCVNTIENALTNIFNFVYDGDHESDPNDIDCLDGFDFEINKYSIKKMKKFVRARQYLHRTGTLFTRLLRDTRGSAIVIMYLNQRHTARDEQLLHNARTIFVRVEQYIAEVCKKAGC